MRVLYLPSSRNGLGPVDRRRFIAFAKANKKIQLTYDSKESFDLVFCSGSGDISLALELKREGFPLIYDYANHYLVEADIIKNFLRPAYFFVKNKHKFSFKSYTKLLKSILTLADIVICSSKDQEFYIRSELNIHSCFVLTDFFETDFPSLFKNNNQITDRLFNRLLWEGQSENLQNFKSVNDKRLFKQKFSLVTDEKYKVKGINRSSINYCKNLFCEFNLIKWSKENLLIEAMKCDLGIIPINMDIPIYASKPENKAVLMFLLGLPVIATPTSAYKLLFEQAGIPEFLVQDSSNWMAHIDSVRSMSKSAQNELSNHLRAYALENYSTAKQCQKWNLLFERSID